MDNASLAQKHLLLAANLISSTTALAVFYTLVFILYFLSFRLSCTQLWDDKGKMQRRTAYTLVFQTVLLICATLDVIVDNRSTQVMYIDNSSLPGGPLGHPTVLSVASLLRVGAIADVIEVLLSSSLLLWRVWVIWSGTRLVIPIAILCSVFYLASAGTAVSFNAISWNVDSRVAATARVQAVVYITGLVLSIATNVFMTSAIITRLLFVRRNHIQLMGKSDVAGQYLGIAAMFIESCLLDTLWGIGILISFCLDYEPTMYLFNTCSLQVDVLTDFLVTYRVLSGRAWTKHTQDHLSTLRWASNGVGASTPGTVDLRQTSVVETTPVVIGSRNDV